jgi:hypothetical protein
MTTHLNEPQRLKDAETRDLERSRRLFLLARAQLAANRTAAGSADTPYMNSAIASPRAAADA